MSLKVESFKKQIEGAKNIKASQTIMKKYHSEKAAHDKKTEVLRASYNKICTELREHDEEDNFDMCHCEQLFIEKCGTQSLKEILEK